MKKLLGLIVLFIIAAVVLSLVQYFRNPNARIIKKPTVTSSNIDTSTPGRNPILSEQQEALLVKAGIDPSTLPTSLTPAMESCFVSKIGANRVEAIKKGINPTLEEIIVAKICLQAK